jgi:hypothetical protein
MEHYPLEWIGDETGLVLALIVRHNYMPATTQFPTPSDYKQQIGFVVYPAGGRVEPHLHLPLERRLTGTSEVILVRRGRARVDFYRDDKVFVASRILDQGDLVLLVTGGHGFEFLEDTVLLEVKQGPYTGLIEKERFEAARKAEP